MSEKIIIEGNTAHLTNGCGNDHVVRVDEFSRGITDHSIQGMYDEPHPDNVRWLITGGIVKICIVELKPELRWMRWLAEDSPAPYGPEATSSERQLATPFVILKVPFRRERVVGRVEVFYRTEPLGKLDGETGALYWPNLLNVSPNAYGCTSWFCTQYLNAGKMERSITAGLNAVTHHLWGAPFNASSEAHEGASTFTKAQRDKIDPRVTDVNRWEAESQSNPEFVLSVKWQPTGKTVRDVIERELKMQRVKTIPDSAAVLGNILLRRRKPR